MGAPVRLTIVEDEGAAEIVCGLLRADGIACGHRSLDVGAEGVTVFGRAREILVAEPDLRRARELLDAAEPVVEACVRCGHRIGDDGGWYETDDGELEPYCGVCAERVFGAA